MELEIYNEYVNNYIQMKKCKKQLYKIERIANKEIQQVLVDILIQKYDDSFQIKSCNFIFENDTLSIYLLLNKKIPFDFISYVCQKFNLDVDYLVKKEIKFIIKED